MVKQDKGEDVTRGMHYLQQELYDLVQNDTAIFEFLQAGSLDGVWYWDLDQPENEWMSPRFWELFGHEPDGKEHLASEWQDMIFPEDLEVALENFHAHCADPTHPYDQIVRYRHTDGSTVWVQCRGIAIRDEQGQPVRMLGAHTDVTLLKEAEARLEQQAKALLRSNRNLEQFAYAASHDLKEPARVMAGFADLLRKGHGHRLDDDGKNLLGFIEDGAARMTQLISDLLALCQIQQNPARIVCVDCGVVVERAVLALGPSVEESGAEISVGELPWSPATRGNCSRPSTTCSATRSSSAPTRRRGSRSRPHEKTAGGWSRWRTTESACRPTNRRRSSRCFAGCTAWTSSPAPASAWRWSRRSSSSTAATSRWSRSPTRARPSAYGCPRRARIRSSGRGWTYSLVQ